MNTELVLELSKKEFSKMIQKILKDDSLSLESEFNLKDGLNLCRYGFQIQSLQCNIIISFTGGILSFDEDVKSFKREFGLGVFVTKKGETIPFEFTQKLKMGEHKYKVSSFMNSDNFKSLYPYEGEPCYKLIPMNDETPQIN